MGEEIFEQRRPFFQGTFGPYELPLTKNEQELVERRDCLIRRIYEVFAGVSRDGGVSWSEAEALDLRRESWAKDSDTGWEELVGDPNWWSESGVGGWSFLDPVGFRYYLPAAMIRSVWSEEDAGISFHLTLPSNPQFIDLRLEQWSALSVRQRICIREFLRYMVASTNLGSPDEFLLGVWVEPFESYWEGVDATDSR